MSPIANTASSPDKVPRHPRVFAAVTVPAPVALALDALARRMALPPQPAVRWTDQANQHLTLAFLGDLAADQLDALAALLHARPPRGPVSITPKAIARFPSPTGGILAALVAEDAPLMAWAQALATTAHRCGIAIDTRAYRPHITLAHLGKGAEMPLPDLALEGLAFRVKRFGLYSGRRINLADGEHYRYQALATFPLA